MADFNLSAAANILKVKYIGPIREQLNNATILMSRILKDSSTINVGGKSFTVPLHSGRNKAAGIGITDGGALPGTAQQLGGFGTSVLPYGTQGYDQAIVPNKYVYGVVSVTGPTIAATRNNADAFVSAITSEIEGCVRDMKKAMNRMLHSDGVDALGYTAATLNNGTALTTDDKRGNPFVQFLAGASQVDILSGSATTTVRVTNVGATLGAVSGNTVAVTLGTASTTNLGDAIVYSGTAGNAMMGIAGIIANTDPGVLGTGLHGLAVASFPYWAAQVFGNSGTNRDLTLALMQKPLSAIASNSDFTDQDVDFLLSSYGVRDAYVALLVAEKRFVNNMQLDGGFRAVDFNGIPLVPDPQCRKNRIYYAVPETMRIFRTSDFDWMDKDGAVLSRVPGYDRYQAVLFHYGDLGCITRNANGLLDDINE